MTGKTSGGSAPDTAPRGDGAAGALPRLVRVDIAPAPDGGAVLRLEIEGGGQVAVQASLDQLDLLADHLDDLLQDGADAD